MGVRVEVELPLVMPLVTPLLLPPVLQESFGLLSEDVGLLKLQVGEVKPNVFSARVVPIPEVLLLWLVLAIKSIAAGATEPGVKVGSSSGFFIPGPFQGLPGSNSGIPKASIPLRASLLALLTIGAGIPPVEIGGGATLLALVPGAPGALLSGHPELVEFVDKPQVSSPPKPNPGVLFGAVLVEPLPPMPTWKKIVKLSMKI